MKKYIKSDRFAKRRSSGFYHWMNYLSDHTYNDVINGFLPVSYLPEVMYAYDSAYNFRNEFDSENYDSELLNYVLDDLYNKGYKFHTSFPQDEYDDILDKYRNYKGE